MPKVWLVMAPRITIQFTRSRHWGDCFNNTFNHGGWVIVAVIHPRQFVNMNEPSLTNHKRLRFRFTIANLMALTGVVALHVAFPSFWLVWTTPCLVLILAFLVAALAMAMETLEISLKTVLSMFTILIVVIFAAALIIKYR